jgi:DnaJ-class molecular chaperone
MTIEIKPGFDVDTVLEYPSMGNQAEACKMSIVRVKFDLDNSQPELQKYARKGDDLYYTHSLSLEEALTTKPFKVKTLDSRMLLVNPEGSITP